MSTQTQDHLESKCHDQFMNTDAMRNRPGSFNSFIALVVLPTASAIAAWINWYGPYDTETTTSLVLTAIPFLGLAIALTHVIVTRVWTNLLMVLPFAAGAVAFAIDWSNVRSSCRADPECNPIPVVMYLTGNLLPVLALGGGIAAWINYRRPAGERIRLHL